MIFPRPSAITPLTSLPLISHGVTEWKTKEFSHTKFTAGTFNVQIIAFNFISVLFPIKTHGLGNSSLLLLVPASKIIKNQHTLPGDVKPSTPKREKPGTETQYNGSHRAFFTFFFLPGPFVIKRNEKKKKRFFCFLVGTREEKEEKETKE